MKRYLVRLLLILMVFTAFSYAIYRDSESEDHAHFHVHVFNVEAAGEFGNCPYCGQPLEGTPFTDRTCTEGSGYEAFCNNASCSYYIEMGASYATAGFLPALGHSYTSTTIKEATCTKSGSIRKICSRCGDQYTRNIDALGHDIEYEEKEATCIEDGYRNGICKRCGEEFNEIYPALGHKYEIYKTLKEATCSEDGQIEATCSRCGEIITDVIDRLGHKYPEEWTLEKEATILQDGLEYKICERCGNKITRIIPHKNQTPIIAAGAAVAVLAVISWYYLVHKRTIRKKMNLNKPSLEDKTVTYLGNDEKFLKLLKSKHYLSVSSCDRETLQETLEENEPDLLIAAIGKKGMLDELLKKKEEEESVLKDKALSLICTPSFLKRNKERLETLKKEGSILAYASSESDTDDLLVKLVLPILKPDLKSDASLENLGMAADLLGIPAVSTIISAYISGKDIKATIEEGEMNVSSVATVISDMASILGLDTIASVAGLVDDVDSIKEAMEEEAGANEKKYGFEGAKDIVEVVSDLIDKD